MSEPATLGPYDDLVRIGLNAIWSQQRYHSIETDVRNVLEAVLPLHEQQVRERIAADLNRQAYSAAISHVDGPGCLEAMTFARAVHVALGQQDSGVAREAAMLDAEEP